MSHVERALTIYGATWERIAEARPDLANIDFDEIWGVDPKHVWSRVEPAKLRLISLMKSLNWQPDSQLMAGGRKLGASVATETYWRRVMDSISSDGLQEFAEWAIKEAPVLPKKPTIVQTLSADEVALLASMSVIQQQAPAQWGTW